MSEKRWHGWGWGPLRVDLDADLSLLSVLSRVAGLRIRWTGVTFKWFSVGVLWRSRVRDE